jgi:hypothetical protein
VHKFVSSTSRLKVLVLYYLQHSSIRGNNLKEGSGFEDYGAYDTYLNMFGDSPDDVEGNLEDTEVKAIDNDIMVGAHISLTLPVVASIKM